tara:strand:+ start:4904 stop:5647 length:744 start_codon:yes stop_codon:yes gene_type:complete
MVEKNNHIESLDSIKIVLVGTSHPGNIGASARAMKNMGFKNLCLVSPKDFPSDVATYRSKAAKDILENAEIHADLKNAISDCQLVIGTSARGRTVPWPVMSPKEAAKDVRKNATNSKVAIVFGREDRGLTNEELGLCNIHVHIPTDVEYSSLNLSQAVQILVYEVRVSFIENLDEEEVWDVDFANNEQTERLINHMDELMQQVEFYDVDNPRKLLLRVRRFFKRSKIDVMEANIFRGLFATIQKKLK